MLGNMLSPSVHTWRNYVSLPEELAAAFTWSIWKSKGAVVQHTSAYQVNIITASLGKNIREEGGSPSQLLSQW